MKPYTYLLGWSDHNRYYYGVRYSKNSDPSELWKSYFTSSNYVREFVDTHGEPDIIEIRKIFDDPDSARKWETRVLRRIGAKDRPDFLNMTDNISISDEAADMGRRNIDYAKVGSSLKKFYENADSEYVKDIKQKRYEGLLNKSESSAKSQSDGIRSYQLQSWSDPESRERRSQSMRKPKSKAQCPHCGKTGGSGIMKRWHFGNCKAIGG